MKKYDVAVIGSGSGNIVIDTAVAKGLKCALIEKNKFGGTCLNHGCIPTKVLTTVADSIRKTQKNNDIGVEVNSYKINFPKIKQRVFEKTMENEQVREYYENLENVDVYHGEGRFLDDNRLKITLEDGSTEEIFADKIIIAVGARTQIPQIDGLDETGYITSESFFGNEFPSSPYESLVIIGGGFIGVEFAHIFSSLGTKVTILQRNINLMPRADEDIIKKATESYISAGIDVATKTQLLKVEKHGNKKKVYYKDVRTNQNLYVVADEIMLCTGLVSNADTLDIQNTSVELDQRGYIPTNELLQTTSKSIYAIGDINGIYQFKHVANMEAEILSHNLFEAENRDYRFMSYNAVPSATFSFPQIASVGMTQKEALEKGYDINVAINHYSNTAKGYALGYKKGSIMDGFVKIITENFSNKILGVHIIGEEASLLLQPYVELLNTGLKYLEPINMQITSNLVDELRANDYTFTNPPYTLASTDNCMVTHPSLAEVSMWTKYMHFENIKKSDTI